MKIISRKEAKEKGLKRYFTGKPCPHGHVCERRVGNYECCECRNKYTKTDEQRSRSASRTRRNYAKNPGRLLEYNKKYRMENPKYFKEYAIKWRNENPEKRRANEAKRRAAKNNSEGSHTGEEILKLYDLQKAKCAHCLTSIKKKYHADHIVPLARGGSNDIYNIQLLCQPCNQKKHSKCPYKFAQENDRLL